MQIQITGKHIETGDALRAHVETQVEAGISKYFERGAEVHITFSKQGHSFRTDCTVHLDSGLRVQASADEGDVYVCFEQALQKVEKQLRRYKRRLKNHHAKTALKEIEQDFEQGNAAAQMLARTLAAEPQDEELPEEYQAVTIAEQLIDIPRLSVSEAVMRMELADADFLIFRTPKSDARPDEGINIVHRRDDGHIGWLDTSQDKF